MPPQAPQPTPPQGMPPMPPHGAPSMPPPIPPMPPQGAPPIPPPMPPSMPSPEHEPSSMQKLPEWVGPKPGNMGSPNNGHKKELLQRLMSNLLSKPGRSMHEMINGVKDAISAYKNYAKEWDTLNGVVTGAAVGGALGGPAGAAVGAGASGIQKIMQDIEAKKGAGAPADGGGGPGFAPQMQGQQRPAMPQPQMRPQTPQPSQNPQGSGWGGEQDDGRGMGGGQPPRVVPAQMGGAPSNGIPPVSGIPPIAGQPQQSSFNRPAPVNSLGIWGH